MRSKDNIKTQEAQSEEFRYDAFISYRHVELDRKWAKWLHTNLETFKVPKKLQAQLGLPKGLSRVFRDEEELPVSSSLSNQIQAALEQSKFLIVICSKDTPESRWVNQEIISFREMGRHDQIVALLIDGEPEESFPDALREIRSKLIEPVSGIEKVQIEEVEPLAADVRTNRSESIATLKNMALLRIMAMLLGCRFDDLRQRHQERAMQRLRMIVTAAVLLVALMAGLSIFAWSQKQQAERNYLAAKTAADSLFKDVALEINALEGIRPETTRKVLNRANDIYDRLLKDTNNDVDVLEAKAEALSVFATTYFSKGDFASAIKASNQGVAIYQTLIDQQPNNPKWKERHALLRMFQIGSFYDKEKEADQADLLRLRQTLIEDLKSLENTGHKSLDLYLTLAALKLESSEADTKSGELQRATNKVLEASSYVNQAKALPGAAENPRFTNTEAITNTQLAEKLNSTGDFDSALFAAQSAFQHYEKILIEHPDTANIRLNTAGVLKTIVDIYRNKGDSDNAEKTLRQAFLAEFSQVDWNSTGQEKFRELADTAVKQADAAYDNKETENAEDWYRLAAAYFEKILTLGSTDQTVQFQFLYCLFKLERFHPENPDLRLSAVQNSLTEIEASLSKFPSTIEYHGQAYARKAQALTALKRYEDAILAYQTASSIFLPQLNDSPKDKRILEMLGLLSFDQAKVEQELSPQDLSKSVALFLNSLDLYEQAMKIDPAFAIDVAMVNKSLALAGDKADIRWPKIVELLEGIDLAEWPERYALLLKEAKEVVRTQ